MRLSTSMSLIAVAVLLSLPVGIGGASIVSVAYAKKATDTTHGSGWQPKLDEQKMTCKQLSGRVQVLILQLRGSGNRPESSGLSRGLHSAFAATIGTTATGDDPEGDKAADMKKLRDYNQRLVNTKCKSYDLDYELKQTDPHETPSARISPPKKH
jgi:hypothetical protein